MVIIQGIATVHAGTAINAISLGLVCLTGFFNSLVFLSVCNVIFVRP